MSRQTQAVSKRAWRMALISLLSVIALTLLLALGIAYRGEQARSALTPDRFDEGWQIRSGTATSDRLLLNPGGLALRHIAATDTFTLQARLTFDQPAGAGGLIVQADDADHFLAFLISPDGYFRVSQYRNGQWIDQVTWRAWPHIQRDGPNFVRAECRSGSCTFFVNDEWTWQADGSAPTTYVGLVALPSASVKFDQVALGQP